MRGLEIQRSVCVYSLLEFQSSVDRLMAVRLLTDVGLLNQDLAAAGEIPSGRLTALRLHGPMTGHWSRIWRKP